jgi:CTP synthase (UTP-ammonia lyase)
MPKKDLAADTCGAEMPMELGDLQAVMEEFMKKLNPIKQEQELLKQDEKQLVEDYSTKLDMKTVKLAMRVADIEKKVQHRDAYDSLLEVLHRVG